MYSVLLAPDVLTELADGFEKRQAFDVADGAADFDQDDVDVRRDRADAVLDLVGDVRNDLHGAAEVVAPALLLDDRLIDLARRPVVVSRGLRVGESLVVAQIEVGFGAVVGDVDLAVLVRAHRAGIDVDIWIELLQRDFVAVALEQGADRRGGQALAERRHHAACHEDVFHRTRFLVHHGFGAPYARASAVNSRRTRSRSSGVSTPIESYVVSTILMENPCSSVRSCSSASARSSGVGSSGRNLEQKFTPLDVQTDMFQWNRLVGPAGRVADVRNGRAGKVQGIAESVGHDLDDMRIAHVVGRAETPAERGHVQRRVVAKRFDGFVDGGRLDERLVALQIDDQVAVQRFGNFGDSIGAGCVRRFRQTHIAAKFCHRVGDALVIGGHQHGVDIARRSGAPVDVLDHRSPRDVGERLSRKTGRRVAGRDDNDSMFMVLGTIADAFGATCGPHGEY